MAALLETRDLWKTYGSASILRGVSLEIPRGRVVTVTGRSGSGKSTLFKLLAGLDRPTRGDVLLEGASLADLTEVQLASLRLRRIGLVFQSFNLLPDLTAHENVRLPMDIAGRPRAEAAERAQKLLDLVHLPHSGNKHPHLLSGGESQRVAIARAIANDPAIVLADEPTGSLDSQNAENVLRVFEELNRTLGATVVIITHDPMVMRRFPERFHLEDGALASSPPIAT